MMNSVFIYKEDLGIEDILEFLNRDGKGVIAFVDNDNKLIGIVTDGDIRRGILNHKTQLKDIINFNPITKDKSICVKELVSYLKKEVKRVVPLVDKDNKLVQLFSLDDIDYNIKENFVVIMAGGLGTRLGELTKDTPKPMLKLGDKPILQHQIERLREQGFVNILLSVNYKAEVIKDYFKDGKELGVNITYLEETTRLGTAGSLSLISKVLNDPFFVLNGDIITDFNFNNLLDFHKEQNSDATMLVRSYKNKLQYGVIEFDDNHNLQEIREKPEFEYFINSGIYMFNYEVISHIPKEEYYDMNSFFDSLKFKNYTLKTYVVNDYWLDIGMVKDYNQANVNMINGLI